MPRKVLFGLATLALTAALAACHTTPAAPDANTPAAEAPTAEVPLPGASTNATGVVPVFAPGLRAQAASPNVAKVFGNAQGVTPFTPWKAQDAKVGARSVAEGAIGGGYTIPFSDFGGVSFAYVTFVNKAGDSDPKALLRYAAAVGKQDLAKPATWSYATIVSGANTARTVLSGFLPDLAVLQTLVEGTKDFQRGQLAALVMPNETTFWAQLKNGRYYDLKARALVSAEDVNRYKADYDKLLSSFALTFERTSAEARRRWANVARLGAVSGDAKSGSLAAPSDTLRAQDASNFCGTRTFLWWSWTACDPEASSGSGDVSAVWDSRVYNEVQPTRAVDGYLIGCGPWSMARLLQWYSDRFGANTLASGPTPYQRLYNSADAMVGLMRSYGPFGGIYRFTNPWDYVDGANAFLSSLGSPRRVAGSYGQPSLDYGNQYNTLVGKFSVNVPVAVIHFSSQMQHIGIATKFLKYSFGDLWVYVPQSPIGATWLNQSALWAAFTSGAYAVN